MTLFTRNCNFLFVCFFFFFVLKTVQSYKTPRSITKGSHSAVKAIIVKVSLSSPGLKSERFFKKLKRYTEQKGDTSGCNRSRKKVIHQSREVCVGITMPTVSSAARSKTWAELYEAGLAQNRARVSANPASNKSALY